MAALPWGNTVQRKNKIKYTDFEDFGLWDEGTEKCYFKIKTRAKEFMINNRIIDSSSWQQTKQKSAIKSDGTTAYGRSRTAIITVKKMWLDLTQS